MEGLEIETKTVTAIKLEPVPTHRLKCLPCFFEAIWEGTKVCEIRKDDRGYAVFDVLELCEWDEHDGYSGRIITACVSHVLTQNEFPEGLIPGYVCLSLGSIVCNV